MTRLLTVSDKVLTRKREIYQEVKIDGCGRVVVKTADGQIIAKPTHQLERTDDPIIEDRLLGDIINHALDLKDDKLTMADRRQRFALSTRIQDAMDKGQALEIDKRDEDHIEDAAALVTVNHMFVERIMQALESAERAAPAKHNGEAKSLATEKARA